MKETEKERTERVQKTFHAIVELLGMENTVELLEHLTVDEEIFDVDAGCGAHSCRHCGACGGSSYEKIEWTDIEDKNGKHLSREEDDTIEHLFGVECLLCGEKYEIWLQKIE